MTDLEAAAFRGVRARERLLAFEGAAIRADLDAALKHLASRLALDPAGYGVTFKVDVDAGVVMIQPGVVDADGPSGHQ